MDLTERWRTVYQRRREAIEGLLAEYPERRSLYLDLIDLHEEHPELAEALFAEPDRVLRGGALALADRHEEFDRVNLRVRNHPGLLPAGAVRTRHVGELVTVEGVVAEAGPVRAALEDGAYACSGCDHRRRRHAAGIEAPDPGDCPECGASLELRASASRFVDVQRLDLRGPDGGVPVYLDDDIVEAADLEDRLLATGVVRIDRRESAPFGFYVSALSVEVDPDDSDQTADGAVGELIRSRWDHI